MHQYLEAIGFGNITTKKKERELLSEVQKHYSQRNIIDEVEENQELRKQFGENIGIAINGDLSDNLEFQPDYYFPYLISKEVSSHADIVIDKRKDNDSYMGICEDVRMGVSIIFYLQNPIDYKRALKENRLSKKGSSVSLIGLMKNGTVLFPIQKIPELEKSHKEDSRNRMMLVSAARKGDTVAQETLTLDDMDTYSKISKRLIKEDVFSIVDSYFMPYGIESDEYSILGEIKRVNTICNEYTKEVLYQMQLEVNEMLMDICVPVDGVLGEPEVGRRFKGTVWLQGHINFVE